MPVDQEEKTERGLRKTLDAVATVVYGRDLQDAENLGVGGVRVLRNLLFHVGLAPILGQMGAPPASVTPPCYVLTALTPTDLAACLM